MKISYNWLKDYIKADLTPAKISEILTSIGLEVEALEKHEIVKGGFQGLVVGHVTECHKHPDADKLSVTKVDIGSDALLNIVCGAPNVAVGQKVIIAPIGTTLYKGEDKFEIKKAKIRGIESQGMICAEDEIGLGTSHAGIMILNEEAVPGTALREYFKITDDFIFEIGLTPNRIDAASHYGVARDLAAYMQHRNPVFLEKPSVDEFKIDNNDNKIDVVIQNPEACIRYSGITVSGITVKESPVWLQDKINSIGLRPINNIVDITNFILHEIGQPLHAFDADYIKGKKVVVKTLAEGTKFITLDEIERTLSSEDLMICNTEEGMCMAGVFGGLHSGVNEKTTSIFIESATFNPVSVRKTARRHGLSTDSSFRFERGTDPNITIYALKRAALLIKEIAGGLISSEIIDVYPKPVKDVTIELNFAYVDELIGKHIPKNTIKEILSSLEIRIIAEKEKSLLIDIPAYRVDVKREADVVEDILRIYGYNNVEVSENVRSNISYSTKPDKEKIYNTISDYLASNGFFEIMTNSLTKATYYENNSVWPEKHSVKIMNPLSNDLGVMRQTLLYGGLESVSYNINRKQKNLKLFEFGNCYSHHKNHEKSEGTKDYVEDHRLSLFITGDKSSESWVLPVKQVSFYFLKSYVENVLKKVGYQIDKLAVSQPDLSVYTEGQMLFYNGKELVSFGLLHKNIAKNLDIKQPVYFAEFLWDNILKENKNHTILFKEITKFPEVRRDLALVLDKAVTYAKIKELAQKTEKKLLHNINLFDEYEGDKIPDGKKSYAISIHLLDENKTLTDFQIDQVMQKLVLVFEKELGAEIRK